MPRYSVLVPAAGSGARFGAEIPKQYLELAGRPMIHHTLSVLCECERIDHVWVVLSAGDEWWDTYDWKSLGPKLRVERCGGSTRAESVANGLAAAAGVLGNDDWLLVHDAARPCLAPERLLSLCDALADDPVGGLLAVPVADTLKRAGDDQRVAETVPRDGLWQAQTPQMFRFGLLRRALAEHSGVTDEAGAIEAAGYRPRLIVSDTTNFKVTYPADLRLAELVLQGRKS